MSGTWQSWLLGVAAAAFGAALLELLSVRPEMKQTMRIVSGLFLLSVIAAPLPRLVSSASISADWDAVASAEAPASDALIHIWKNAVEQEIRKTAAAMDLPVTRVEIEASADESGCINIQSMIVYTDCSSAGQRNAFSDRLADVLGCRAAVKWEQTE